ncbi:hypothetical protein IT774_16195 [Salinimonas marina]|uniref:Flagellar basal-body/hook protein C-terminal domain-containing protein n=1 Tax=Salinimonas marina TaxID=2785918 RepID=A0A7S9HCU1_9ALTE|nr:hypothetical protein [Salinimonas marina]QPG05601.1 hypothetical protein IT774_16195 [Salinimonas marina]
MAMPAFGSARQALDSASQEMSEAAHNIARQTGQSAATDSSSAPVAATGPVAGGLTDDIVALQYSNRQGQAAARVLEVSNDTLGRLIDTLA